jgi:UDP-3-O-[3-hydroxymyristoyl] N-acetylglucosamine deacetylase
MTGVKEQAVKLTARGITSRREITTTVTRQHAGHGIVFQLPAGDGSTVRIPARTHYVVNTLRNVTLGTKTSEAADCSPQSIRLCIVEHFLSAAALWGLNDLLVHIDGPEFPLGDGGSKMWLDLFKDAGWERTPQQATRELPMPITIQKGDRTLMAIPADSFSVTYLMDWNHPAIGRCWYCWTPEQPVESVLDARTFGSMQEHQLLGIADEVVSLTPEGFSQPLRFPDEPVRHKVLDLIGDLMLAGVNPQTWKARFISIKGGHEMDVDLAKELAKLL